MRLFSKKKKETKSGCRGGNCTSETMERAKTAGRMVATHKTVSTNKLK